MGKWLMIAALLGLLALALWVTYREWLLVLDVSMPGWAWGLMAVGVALTIFVGAGLMALIFYSSRMGYDEPPHQDGFEKDNR
jgi:predicted membrane protein